MPAIRDLARRLIRFVSATAKDVLLPNVVDKVMRIGQNFYQCFLVTDVKEQLQLLSEAGNLTAEQIDEAARAIVEHWQQTSPDVPLPPDAFQWAKQIVENLSRANRKQSRQESPAEALRQSFNEDLLSGNPQKIPRSQLSPGQQAIGSLVTSGILQGTSSTQSQAQTLPEDAPAIPGYELLRILGSGGFSTVYLARHLQSGELRAVKVGELGDTQRLKREIRILKNVQSEHLVDYYEHGEIGERYWIAMEYLGDHSLAQLLNNPASKPNLEQALLIAEQILRGLVALHDKGIIHRDLKPANVMIDQSFRLKLIDFGLSKAFHASPHSRSETVTMAGHTVGTPQYMSPEQAMGADLSFSSDVWSFGVILYEMLTGSSPFQATTLMGLGAEILNKEIDLNREDVPKEVRKVLDRCLQRETNKRCPNASVVLQGYDKFIVGLLRRMRHERYRESWRQILERRALEWFAEKCRGELTEDGIQRFLDALRGRGIEEIDMDLLREILPPIFQQQRRVEEVRHALEDAKRRLQADIVKLTADDIAHAGRRIKELEQAQERETAKVTEIVRHLLRDAAGNLPDAGQRGRPPRARKAKAVEEDDMIVALEDEEILIEEDEEEDEVVAVKRAPRHSFPAIFWVWALLLTEVGVLTLFVLNVPTGAAWFDGAIGGAIVGLAFGMFLGVLDSRERARTSWGVGFTLSVLGGIGGAVGAAFGVLFSILVVLVILVGMFLIALIGDRSNMDKEAISGFLAGLVLAALVGLVTGFAGIAVLEDSLGFGSWFHLQGLPIGFFCGVFTFALIAIFSENWRTIKPVTLGSIFAAVIGMTTSLGAGLIHPIVGLGLAAVQGIILFRAFVTNVNSTDTKRRGSRKRRRRRGR